jgi:hypothetical protein
LFESGNNTEVEPGSGSSIMGYAEFVRVKMYRIIQMIILIIKAALKNT